MPTPATEIHIPQSMVTHFPPKPSSQLGAPVASSCSIVDSKFLRERQIQEITNQRDSYAMTCRLRVPRAVLGLVRRDGIEPKEHANSKEHARYDLMVTEHQIPYLLFLENFSLFFSWCCDSSFCRMHKFAPEPEAHRKVHNEAYEKLRCKPTNREGTIKANPEDGEFRKDSLEDHVFDSDFWLMESSSYDEVAAKTGQQQ